MVNRRRYLRYETNIVARIYPENFNLSVKVIDISKGGIGIISENPIQMGSKLTISLYPIIENPIEGTSVWSSYIERQQKYYHRIGIETDLLTLDKMNILGFTINSRLGSDNVYQSNKNGK